MHRKRNREKKIYPIMNYLKIKIKMLKQKRNAWWSHTQHTISHMYSIQYVHVPSANVFPKQVWQHCDLRAHSSYSLGRWDSSVSPEISFVSHTHTHTHRRVIRYISCCRKWREGLCCTKPFVSQPSRSWSLHLCMWVDNSRRTGKKLSLYGNNMEIITTTTTTERKWKDNE